MAVLICLYQPQRLITLKTKYNRTGTIKPELKATRVQAADSVVKFMYGTVLKDTHACDACQKGNGLYDGYVVLNDLTPGCANCHYAGTANKCSLVTGKCLFLFVYNCTANIMKPKRNSPRHQAIASVRVRTYPNRPNLLPPSVIDTGPSPAALLALYLV